MPEQSLSNTNILSIRHITVILHSRTLDSTLAISMVAVFNCEVTNKKHKNAKCMALTTSWKDTCLQCETERRRQSVTLFDLIWEHKCVSSDSYFSLLSQLMRKEPWYWFRVTNEFCQVGKFANMDSTNNKNQLYLNLCMHFTTDGHLICFYLWGTLQTLLL